ncbi:hypothetical protein [Saccharopolyspora elongata]|nr:hypothetical protein [Saccharopolyspora elongata]
MAVRPDQRGADRRPARAVPGEFVAAAGEVELDVTPGRKWR